MAYFNFNSLIKKYETTFTVITSGEGYYNNLGDYAETEPAETTMEGAIISLREDKIYRSEGLLTSQDRQLYMLNPLPKGLIGSTVIHKGNKYKVQEAVDNGEFTGVYAYLLKYVSAFKETPAAGDITEDLDRLEKRLEGVLVEKPEDPKTDNLAEMSEKLGKRLGGELID